MKRKVNIMETKIRVTLDGEPAFIEQKLTYGRVRVKTEDGKKSRVFGIKDIARSHGRLSSPDERPPTRRDLRMFGRSFNNQLAKALAL